MVYAIDNKIYKKRNLKVIVKNICMMKKLIDYNKLKTIRKMANY